jgi:hypothetical protein
MIVVVSASPVKMKNSSTLAADTDIEIHLNFRSVMSFDECGGS